MSFWYNIILLVFFSLVACGRTTRDNQQRKSDTISKAEKEMVQKLQVGDTAPEFSLPDTEGRMVHLSDFQGKYLFLDFWASWCLPCRKENPDFVKIYDKYRSDNFEMLGIAFDKRKDKWLDAIQSDGLEWPQVSDLQYFDSEMIKLYGIVNVPTTMLLDPEGKIIAIDLHASDLEKLLLNEL